jgi:hypothetical protein
VAISSRTRPKDRATEHSGQGNLRKRGKRANSKRRRRNQQQATQGGD